MRQPLILATAEETEALGARLARALPPRSQALQLHLYGDLGAGKTTLTRGFLQAMGYAGAVRSPTYTLVEIYVMGTLTVVHADLYRLQDPQEFEALGLRDLALPGHVWLIEWPQRAGQWLPAPDLRVTLTAQTTFHTAQIEAPSEIGSAWIAAF